MTGPETGSTIAAPAPGTTRPRVSRRILALVVLVLALSAVVRLVDLARYPDTVFDEHYYAHDAAVILRGDLAGSTAEPWKPAAVRSAAHPDLAKLAIAAGIAVLGDNAVGVARPGRPCRRRSHRARVPARTPAGPERRVGAGGDGPRRLRPDAHARVPSRRPRHVRRAGDRGRRLSRAQVRAVRLPHRLARGVRRGHGRRRSPASGRARSPSRRRCSSWCRRSWRTGGAGSGRSRCSGRWS